MIARILAGMILGALVGLAFGDRAARLGEFGSAIIDLIKALAGPLLFLSVVDAFLRTRINPRSAGRMIAISATNGALAIVIGLTLSNTLRPGERLAASAMQGPVTPAAGKAPAFAARPIDFLSEVLAYLPKSVVRPFLDNSVITIVLLAVFCGWSLRRVKGEQAARGEAAYRAAEDLVATALRAVELMLAAVLTLVPVAVFCVVAKTIGHDGFRPLGGLAAYVGVAVLGLAIQVGIIYQGWLVLVARMPLKAFWSGAREALVYALGASSSLATLPVTLRCLDRMKVSPESARMAACVGTNLNNDGILLYEAMAVLFVAQVHGIHLSFVQQVVAALSCVLAGIGIAAVPDAGLISLTLVLATVGLPVQDVPLLLTVDWLLSRCRAMTNVSSDLLVAVLLDRLEGPEAVSDSARFASDATVPPGDDERVEALAR